MRGEKNANDVASFSLSQCAPKAYFDSLPLGDLSHTMLVHNNKHQNHKMKEKLEEKNEKGNEGT